MNDTQRAEVRANEPPTEQLSALDIDIRCAIIMSRIALETLVEAAPENNLRIQGALDHAIEGARLENADGVDAVVGLLNSLKQRLHVAASEHKVWYVE